MAATTFVIGSGDIVRPYFLEHRIVIRSFPEAASQTFKTGDVLILETAANKGNEVKIAADNPTTGVVGVAVHDATGTEFTGWSGTAGGGSGSRTDSSALGAGSASSLGPGIAGSLGVGITGGLTKGLVQVYLATEAAYFIARSLDGQTLNNNDLGKQFGMKRDATNKIWRIDNTDTTNKVCQIVDLFDAPGDINGRYIFKFVAAVKALYGER